MNTFWIYMVVDRMNKAGGRSLAITSLVAGCLLSCVASAQTTPAILAIAQPAIAASESTNPADGKEEPKVHVNRTVPNVHPPSPLHFSANPHDAEISQARVFQEPLVPIDGDASAAENRELSQSLLQFNDRADREDYSAIEQFLDKHPHSVWRASLLLNLGLESYRTARYSRVFDYLDSAWTASKDSQEASARAVADLAVSELLKMNARVGRMDRITELLKEIEGRKIIGSATEKVVAAREGLWSMQNRPEKSFRCGPLALDRILASQHSTLAGCDLIRNSRSTTNGIPMPEVLGLANQLRMNYQIAFRTPGAQVILPAVIHWKVGHYAALIRQQDGKYQAQDPTFRNDVWLTRSTLDSEASGYFLVPAGQLPEGWRTVSNEEGKRIWGKGSTSFSDPDETTAYDETTDEDEPFEDPPLDDDMQDQPTCEQGMPVYHISLMEISSRISDIPVGYNPPRGLPIHFEITYNQREANQPAIFTYSSLGPKWTFNWLCYITDSPSSPSADVQYYVSGGGALTFTGFDTPSQTFAMQPQSRAQLKRTSSTSYELTFPDGLRKIFSQPDGSTGSSRKVFLTQIIDAAGNTVSLTYDSYLRIVAITDALGQVTTLSYNSSGHFYNISKVTDPFGRFAVFTYNNLGELDHITDEIGMGSSFIYDGDFVTQMITPYGTTTFQTGDFNFGGTGTRHRWIIVTDPAGQQERAVYVDGSLGTEISYDSVPTNLVPQNMIVTNSNLSYRNTFYWDKHAMGLASRGSFTNYTSTDYSYATIYHWQHGADFVSVSGVTESFKSPLEGRVWYEYPPSGTNVVPTQALNSLDQPAKIGRVLDDGTTQLRQFEYTNAFGKVTKSTDPAGRATSYIYSTNGLDLLEVRQTTGTNNQLLSSFTYNSQHRPLSSTDASGQTTHFGYNTNGQLIATTNALNQTMTMSYDADGYLTNITGAISGAVTTMTYDSYGRLKTVTDSEGYTITNLYDNLDRPTFTYFPDGTYTQTIYDKLDAVRTKDRRGHWTARQYDKVRRVTDVLDPLGRTTHFDWCGCGALESITDALGHTTTWNRDIQSRVTSKVYPDGSAITNAYESTTSRLKVVTDALKQATVFTYNVDDTTARITYTNAVIPTPGVTNTFDPIYNRISTMADGTGTTTYFYNPITVTPVLGAGQLFQISNSQSVITYRYDELGRTTNRAIDGVGINSTFDALGRVTIFTNALGSFTNSYVNTTPRLSRVSYPNGQTASFGYFGNVNDQRLQTIANTNSGGSVISKFDYSYDVDGQIKTWTQQADSATPKVLVAEYDPVDQLLSATVHSNSVIGAVLKEFVYAYDKAGNRTSEQIGAAIQNASHNNLNQLTNSSGGGPMRFKGHLNELGAVTVGGNTAVVDHTTTNFIGFANVSAGTNTVPIVAADYSGNKSTNNYQVVVSIGSEAKTLKYDANGSLTNVTSATVTNSYQWDAANRLVTLTQHLTNQTLTSEFYYDGLDRRIAITERQNGSIVSSNLYVWCGTELCEERNSGTVTKRFFGAGEQISSTNYFFTKDHLGSIREMTDSGGTIHARYDYDPYGRRTKVSGDLDADFSFTGHYRHSVSGLSLTLYRQYDPDLGRWLSRDPIQESGGPNHYIYVLNNPTDSIDPLGLVWYNPASWNWSKIGSGVEFKGGLQVGLEAKAKLSVLEGEIGADYGGGAVFNLGSGKLGKTGTYLEGQAGVFLKCHKYQAGLGKEWELQLYGNRDPYDDRTYKEEKSNTVLGFKASSVGTDSTDWSTIKIGGTFVVLHGEVGVNLASIWNGITK